MNQTSTFETDPHLPSGEWSGFYIEDHQPRRGWMHLYINFENGVIAGEGTDYVGPWVIKGAYDLDTRTCQWTKHYQGKHDVNYRGTITDNGIQGLWNIRGWRDGPFHIWPRRRHDLHNLYLQDELETGEPSVLLGAVPVPPADFV